MPSGFVGPGKFRPLALGVILLSILFLSSVRGSAAQASPIQMPPGVQVAQGVNVDGEEPPIVDLRSKVPRPIDQGALGACTTYALTYVVGSYWSGRLLDPLPTYAQGLAVRSGGNQAQFAGNGGITVLEGYNAMFSFGAYDIVGKVRRSTWHRLPSAPGFGHFAGMDILRLGPSIGQDLIGKEIKEELAIGRPVVLVMHYSPELALGFTGDRLSQISETGRYHAVAAVGYTPDGVIIQNSRGEGWGRHGFAIAPWTLMERLTVEAYVPFGWSLV